METGACAVTIYFVPCGRINGMLGDMCQHLLQRLARLPQFALPDEHRPELMANIDLHGKRDLPKDGVVDQPRIKLRGCDLITLAIVNDPKLFHQLCIKLGLLLPMY